MDNKQKQQALVKLAQVRLAINHVMRKRAMTKQQVIMTLIIPVGAVCGLYLIDHVLCGEQGDNYARLKIYLQIEIRLFVMVLLEEKHILKITY